uniref:Uncharacterized protein n=1 Tax=Salix viminalis TaxID=40686 RepID=A0A6N2KRU8_SALVM
MELLFRENKETKISEVLVYGYYTYSNSEWSAKLEGRGLFFLDDEAASESAEIKENTSAKNRRMRLEW